MNESEKNKSLLTRFLGTSAECRASLRRCSRMGLCVVVSLATLIALFYVEEDWRGKRAWNAYAKEAAAKGEVLDLAALAPPPIPDDQNFAMTPFLKPLFDFLPGTQTWRDRKAATNRMEFAADIPASWQVQKRDWRLGERTDWPAWQAAIGKAARKATAGSATTNASLTTNRVEAARSVLAALRKCEPVLTELQTASEQRPRCRFNLRYEEENYAALLVPHLMVIRGCVHLLALRAGAELTLGQTEAALKDLDLAFFLTDTIRNEPIPISQLVRCATTQLTLQPLWEGLVDRRWSEAQLEHLQQRLARFDFLADAQLALRGERADGNGIIVYARNHRGRLGVLGMTEAGDESQASMIGLVAALVPRGWFYLEQVSYNRAFDAYVRLGVDLASRRVDPQVIAQNEKAIEQSLQGGGSLFFGHRLMAAVLLPAIPQAYRKFAYFQTLVDEATLACALERYRLANGHYPDALADLTPQFVAKLPHDVITGEPLKYRRTDNGRFVLYSVGWNGKDDGGMIAMSGKSKTNMDIGEGDWVWPQP